MAMSGNVPAYAASSFLNGGGGGGAPSGAGISQYLSGLFGNTGSPFREAGHAYTPYLEKGVNTLNPFYNAGSSAIPQYQGALNRMSDPASFLNNLMNQYQESPFAKFQQQQSVRAANNMGSASGLTGSTPLTQFAEQNARNISSEDMQNWLSNALGINTQFLGGQQNLINQGLNAGSSISNLYGNAANYMGDVAYGNEYGKNVDSSNKTGGLIHMLTNGFLG